MNKIQQAMRNKVNEALGEVEYQLDLFVDNGYKSNFKIDKYLKQLEFKKKLVQMMRPEWDSLIDEVSSDDPDFVEGYSFMTKPQKNRFIKFLRGLGEGCDKYMADNELAWKQESQMRRIRNKSKKTPSSCRIELLQHIKNHLDLYLSLYNNINRGESSGMGQRGQVSQNPQAFNRLMCATPPASIGVYYGIYY